MNGASRNIKGACLEKRWIWATHFVWKLTTFSVWPCPRLRQLWRWHCISRSIRPATFHENLRLPQSNFTRYSPRPRKITRQHHCNFANFAVATKSYNTTATSPFVEKGRAYNQGYFFLSSSFHPFLFSPFSSLLHFWYFFSALLILLFCATLPSSLLFFIPPCCSEFFLGLLCSKLFHFIFFHAVMLAIGHSSLAAYWNCPCEKQSVKERQKSATKFFRRTLQHQQLCSSWFGALQVEVPPWSPKVPQKSIDSYWIVALC